MSDKVLELKNVSKCFGKNKVVDNVSFHIDKGAIVGLIGPNGAGKTTIMKMLGGLSFPTEGEIFLFGETGESALSKARSRMSFIIETPYMDGELSGYENLEKQRLQKGIPDKDVVERVMNIVGLSPTDKKKTRKYSLGMKQRLGIACSLLSKPEIIVLDEPINGLDPKGIIQVRELIIDLAKNEHMTVLISSHILSELSLMCTDYVFINKGKIVDTLTKDELGLKCRQYYHINTDNNELAVSLLREKMGIEELIVDDEGKICLYERLENIKDISRFLYEANIIPIELTPVKANLEDFFMNIISE